MNLEIIAQGIMVLTLLLMVIGKTPIYSTAIIGSTIGATASSSTTCSIIGSTTEVGSIVTITSSHNKAGSSQQACFEISSSMLLIKTSFFFLA